MSAQASSDWQLHPSGVVVEAHVPETGSQVGASRQGPLAGPGHAVVAVGRHAPSVHAEADEQTSRSSHGVPSAAPSQVAAPVANRSAPINAVPDVAPYCTKFAAKRTRCPDASYATSITSVCPLVGRP